MQLYCAGFTQGFSTLTLCWAVCCLLATPVVLADTLPSAGSLQQSNQAGREFNIPSKPPTTSLPPVQAKQISSGGATVIVSQFRWVGNSLFSDDVLNRLTKDMLGRQIDFAKLESAAMSVANLYRAAGYVVQTKLPTQDIANGIVTIEITEATFGKVLMDGPSSKRIDAKRIRETIYAFQPIGAKLNSNNIDRALAVLSDLAGIRVNGQLLQGAQAGQTDFVVTTQDLPAISIDSSADNAGARSTGQDRVSLSFKLNSPLRLGDQFTANALSSKGSDYFRAAYQWPVGHRGWTLGLNGSRLNYKVTDVAFSALPLKGSANAFGLDTTYPLIWRNRYKLNAVLSWDIKTYENLRSEEVVTSYTTRGVNAGLQGQFSDEWAGGGVSTWQLMGAGGRLKKKTDTSSSLTTGHFEKINYNFTRAQDLSSSMSLHAALNGQASKNNLDASERFYLGGMSGVRAYPSSEAGGSAGRLLTIEFRHRLNINNTWFAFYDHGRVVVNPSSSAALNAFELKGYGVGYGFVSANGISLKAMVARRLGRNPNPTSTGQDQDGSLAMNRFWLNANLAF